MPRRSRPASGVVPWLVAAVLATGCGARPVPAPQLPAMSPLPAEAVAEFVVPSPPAPAPVTEQCPPAPPRAEVVDPATLTLVEKAGLVLAVGIPHALEAGDPAALAATGLGVGAVVLKRANIRSQEQVRRLVEEMAAASPLGLLFLVDHEGGRVAHADAVVPGTLSARRLGDAGPEAARRAGATIGTALRAAGIHANLAPVADLDGGSWNGIIGDRSFGATPDEAIPAATAFLAGLHDRGTLGVIKHFPGHAGAGNTHAGDATPTVGARELRQVHLQPFRALIDAGADAVMVGHVTYPGLGSLPASLNPQVYELLRAGGYDGVAMTDSLGMGAVQLHGGHAGATVAALRAGADILLANQGGPAVASMRDAIVAAVRSGEVAPARLDEAVRRVMLLRARQAEIAAGCR